MGILPVPAKQYFADFAFDLVDYQVIRKGKPVATMKGLSNSSHGQQFVVSRIDYDTYNGQKQLINAYAR